MRKLARVAFVASTVAIVGCVGSLYTLWSGPDMVMDRRLIGTWKDSTGKDYFEITAAGAASYSVVFHDDSGRVGRFVGLLGHLGGRTILDVQPDVTQLRAPDAFTGLLQPMHGFVVVDHLEGHARAAVLDPDSLRRYMLAHPGAIRGDTLSSGVVLSAGPAQLRAFLATYLQRPGVLQEPGTFIRQP